MVVVAAKVAFAVVQQAVLTQLTVAGAHVEYRVVTSTDKA
jgi:hypothetical protein